MHYFEECAPPLIRGLMSPNPPDLQGIKIIELLLP